MKRKIFFSIPYFNIILYLSNCHDLEKLTIRNPNVRPNMSQQYLCSSVKIDIEHSYYITGFETHKSPTAHHVLLYGCTKPASAESVWDCGIASPCEETRPEIVFPFLYPIQLREGFGFKVGKDTRIEYFVLQVHYKNTDHLTNSSTHNTAVTLSMTSDPSTKSVGIYAVSVRGAIPPHGVEHMEAACAMRENKTLRPLHYVLHTHSLGRVVSGYVVKNHSEWLELGKGSPKFSRILDTHYNGTISQGDVVAVRCTMLSDRDDWTYVGLTTKDEMCNFYLIYYVEDGQMLEEQFCIGVGPPDYYWRSGGFTNIPDEQASVL